MRAVASLFLLLWLSVNAFASDFKSQCSKFSPPLTGGYCVHSPTGNSSGDILYYLHGRGNSEFTWQENWYYTAQLRDEWKKNGVSYPTVVSVSFGPTWILAEKNSSNNSGLFEIFTARVIPSIEAQIGGLNGRRIVFGDSMGGFNSIQLALKTSLFSKAGILCSPMSEISPFAPEKKILEHIKQSSAWQYYKDYDPNAVLDSVKAVIELTHAFYPSESDWSKADPIPLAKDSKSSTELYVAVGFYDRFAAYEGNEKFVSVLQSLGFKVDWRPQWGGHCAIDIQSLAKFLVE